MITTPFLVGEKELLLRYENKQQQDIKHNAPKKFDINRKFSSPMEILNYLGDTDIQVYLLQKGLEHETSGVEKITEDKAANLRQEYLEMGEPDAGEKYEAFQGVLAEALSLNVMGASGKKLIAKGKETTKEAKLEELVDIYEAKILAEERAKTKLLSEQQSASSD